MPWLYIIESSIKPRWYVGVTGRSLGERLEEHNRGQTYSTRKHLPWNHVYNEEYTTLAEAMKRERYLKSVHGYKERQDIIIKYKKRW